MTTKNKSSIKLLAILALLAAIFSCLTPISATLSSIFAYNKNITSFTAPTQSQYINRKLDITNPNFASPATTTYSTSLSSNGWNGVATDTNSAIAAIVNTSVEGFDEFTKSNLINTQPYMTHTPNTRTKTDTQVLAIAATNANYRAIMGYQSSQITLYGDGFFEINVDFYAVGSIGSVYLLSDTEFPNDRRDISVELSRSSNSDPNKSDWQTATFFVKTDPLSSHNINIALYLGTQDTPSSGVIYFDNIVATAHSERTFSSAYSSGSSKPYTEYVDLTETDEREETPVISSNFDSSTNTILTSTRPNYSGVIAHPYVSLADLTSDGCLNLDPKNTKQIFGNESINNTGVAFVAARNETSSLKTPRFTLNRNTIYMISFYTLATEDTYMRVYDYRLKDEDFADELAYYEIAPYDTGYFSITPTTTDEAVARNNWVRKTAFIIGGCLTDTICEIEFSVGGEEAKTGYIILDDLSVQRVSHDYYEKHMNTTNVIDKTDVDAENRDTTLNAEFNFGSTNTANAPYPLRATSWTITAEKDSAIKNGIVNTEDSHFTTYSSLDDGMAYGTFGKESNPHEIIPSQSNNNAYMMQNVTSTYQKLTSSEIALGTETATKISFYSATYIPQNITEINFAATLEVNGKEIARIDLSRDISVSHENPLSAWQSHEFIVKTSKFANPKVRISFELGGDEQSKTVGVAYIDKIRTSQVSTSVVIDEDDRSQVDLSDTIKIASADGESLTFETGAHNLNATVRNNILSITTFDSPVSATLTSAFTIPLEGGSMYEYSIWVAIGTITPYINPDLELDDPDYGIVFSLYKMEGGSNPLTGAILSDIDAEDPDEEGFTKLTFLINSISSFDMALSITFGSSDVPVSGSLSIKKSQLTQITDETQFNESKKEALDNETMFLITKAIDASDEENNEETSEGEGTNFSFLMIPSIIMGVALIIAIAGTIIRRTKFRFHIKKRTSSYARDDTSLKLPPKKSIKATKTVKE